VTPVLCDLASIEELFHSSGAIWGYADVSGLFKAYPLFPRAISLALPLPAEAMLDVENGPTTAYYNAYCDLNLRLNALSAQVESALITLGYASLAFPATVSQQALSDLGTDMNAPIPHKTIATRAGLGWIGKNALLVTTQYGPRVRLASVLTQAPLMAAAPVVTGRCGRCERCVKACPAQALTG
jgi:epoxyqueuosine reductase